MRETEFIQGIKSIYATFSKKLPEQEVLDEIYKRVKDMPAEFMPFAQTQLQDEERLPTNLGRFLAQDAWAAWQIQHGLKTMRVETGCRECDPKTPGWIPVTRGGYDYLAKCVCNLDFRFPESGRTRQELVDEGYTLRPMGARR